MKIFKKLMVLLLLLPVLASAETFEAGKDYELLPAQGNTSEKGKIKIMEFFSYGCPACFNMEEQLNSWLKRKTPQISFERVPVVFNKTWEIYAKAYYTAQLLSLTEKLNPVLFKAIHNDKKTLSTNESMIDIFVSQGADKAVVSSAFEHSMTIDMMVKNGMTMMSKYQIGVIPSFVVNQRYKTDLQMAKNPERLLQILDYLISIDKASS